MKHTIHAAAVLLTLAASPTYAEPSHVWTNADLGKPLSPNRPTVTAEQLRVLAEHQFRSAPNQDNGGGPRIFIMGSSSTAGPFGEFTQLPDRRLDGSPWSDSPWLGGGYGFWPGVYGGPLPSRPFRRPNRVGPSPTMPRPVTRAR